MAYTLRSLDESLGPVAVPFNPSLPAATGRIVGEHLADVVNATLLTAGTGIEHENLHLSKAKSNS
jgi:hypothetical protein